MLVFVPAAGVLRSSATLQPDPNGFGRIFCRFDSQSRQAVLQLTEVQSAAVIV